MKNAKTNLIGIFLILILNPAFASELCSYNGAEIATRSWEGLDATHPSVVDRELDKSNKFDCDKWLKEKDALESLGIFAEVSLSVQYIDSTQATQTKTTQVNKKQVNLTYRVKELLPWLPIPAMKKSDQVGWMLGPGLAAVNLFGRDIFVQAFYRTDVYPNFNTTDEFLVSVHSPYVGDVPLEYSFGWLKLSTMNLNKEFEENSHDIQFNSKYPLLGQLEWVFLAGGYLVERNSDPRFERSIGISKSNSIGTGLAYDSRDNLTNPRKGSYQELSFRKFGGKNLGGSEADFSEVLLDQQIYQAFGRHIFLGGNLMRWRNGKVPFYETFEAGGANSFRAWMPGPDHSGESELLSNLEYRFELIPKTFFVVPWINQPSYWGLQPVVGYDFINLWSQDGRGDEMEHAYYVGLHILLPALNRIRIEVGSAVSSVEIVTQIGLFEKYQTSRWRIR